MSELSAGDREVVDLVHTPNGVTKLFAVLETVDTDEQRAATAKRIARDIGRLRQHLDAALADAALADLRTVQHALARRL